MNKLPIITAALVASAISLAGCSSASPAPAVTTVPPVASTIPKPSAAQESSLLAELGKIHPALNHERSVGRASNVCQDILGGEQSEASILDRAKQRFEGGSTGPLTQDQASSIVAVINANGFCVK